MIHKNSLNRDRVKERQKEESKRNWIIYFNYLYETNPHLDKNLNNNEDWKEIKDKKIRYRKESRDMK